jgi:hypothetical protein
MLQWNQGDFLDKLNLATVKPLREKGDTQDTQNYNTYLPHQFLQKL